MDMCYKAVVCMLHREASSAPVNRSRRGAESTSYPHAETERQGKAAYRMVAIIKASSTGLSLRLLGLLLVKQGLQP